MDYSTHNIKNSVPLRRDNVLKCVTDTDIYQHFINVYPTVGSLILSPLRQDGHPTLSFYSSGNKVKWKDFATGEVGDVFDMLMKMYNTTMYGALCLINVRMGLGLGVGNMVKDMSRVEKMQRSFVPKAKVLIQIEPKQYTDTELEYWAQFGISYQTLVKNNVYSCSRVFMNRKLVTISKQEDPTFAYHFPAEDTVKVYKPLNPGFKWFGNVTSSDIYGASTFKEGGTLIITSSGKDVMTLQELGYMAGAPQGEGNHFDITIQEMIKISNRVTLFYDNDRAGRLNSQQKSEQFSTGQIFTPNEDAKDPSDFAKVYGKDALKSYVDEQLKLLITQHSKFMEGVNESFYEGNISQAAVPESGQSPFTERDLPF